MSPEIPDTKFLELKLPSYDFADTTPEVQDDFRGFRVAAPKRLTAAEGLRVPVSALARFGEEANDMPRPLWDAVVAIVTEVGTNRCWVGRLMQPDRVPLARPDPDAEPAPPDPDDEPVPPAAAGDDADDDIQEIGGMGPASRSAHVDLRHLLELPGTPGTYDIHLTYGPWASNVVRTVVERAREED